MQQWQPQQPPGGFGPHQPLPGALPPKDAEDRDLAALSPFWPKVAAGLVAVAGLCGVLGAVQTWTTVEFFDAWMVVPPLVALLGVACIGVAARLVTARRWAAIAALVASALLGVVSGVFCIYALLIRFIAVFVLLAPVLSLPALVLAALSIGACDRAEKARDRLRGQGLELGL
jgi:hypothetical protein